MRINGRYLENLKWKYNNLFTNMYLETLLQMRQKASICVRKGWLISVLPCVHGTENHSSITLSHIQQICSRRRWKHHSEKRDIIYKWKNNYCIKLKALWQNGKIAHVQFFQKSSPAKASESVYMWEKDKQWNILSVIKVNTTNYPVRYYKSRLLLKQ